MVKYLSANEIKVRHQYLPGRNTANKKYPIVIKSERPLMHVYQEGDGNFLLFRGIETYHSLKVLNDSFKVPCQIYIKSLNLYDWTIKLLQAAYTENLYWKVKYELFSILLYEERVSAKQISEDSGVELKEIEKHIVDPEVPFMIEKLAIKYKKQPLINEIWKEKCLTRSTKILLIQAIFNDNKPLTGEQFKLFKKYIKADYEFDPLEKNAMKKLREIVNKNAALNFYWSSLNSDSQYQYKRFYFTMLNVKCWKENKAY